MPPDRKPREKSNLREPRFWLPALSGLLVLGAFPPINFIPLLFVGLVPLLHALMTAPTRRAAWRAGYRFGMVYMLGQFLFFFILANRWTGNPIIGVIPWLAAAALAQLYFGLAALAAFRAFALAQTRPWFALLVPVAWAGVEVLRCQVPFIGFPWGLLATPLWRYPELLGVARYLTVFGLSAWVVVINLTFTAFLQRDFKGVRRYALVSLGFLGASILQYRSADPPGDTVKVFCGQPGVDVAFGDPQAQDAKQGANIDLLLDEAEAHDPDLIVLPEGVARLGDADPPQPPFKLPSQAAIVFGAQRTKLGNENLIYQSVFGFDGHTWSHSDKSRLVIFGEYLPLRPLFGPLFHLDFADMEPGRNALLPVITPRGRKIEIGPLICFEGLFFDLAQLQARSGAQLLAVESVDDWFMGSPAPEQLEAAAVFRSVETNLPSVRAASTGHTMACDNKGRVLAEVPIQIRAGMPVSVTVPDHPQPVWWLSAFPWLSFLTWLGLALAPAAKAEQTTSVGEAAKKDARVNRRRPTQNAL
jgi:apolipoprotein N-acyltransferase